MVNVPENELRKLRAEFEAEIQHIELQVSNLKEKLQQKREQIRAINTLVEPLNGGTGPNSTKSVPPGPTSPSVESPSDITPTDAYWIPILDALEGRGGRDHCDIVLDLVEKKMAPILKAEDYELLPSGISVRWRNRAQWQRQNMVQQGLLSRNSPRGIWEITPAGRGWLQEKRKKAS